MVSLKSPHLEIFFLCNRKYGELTLEILGLLEFDGTKIITTRNFSKHVENMIAHPLLVGMQNGEVTAENSLMFSYYIKHGFAV